MRMGSLGRPALERPAPTNHPPAKPWGFKLELLKAAIKPESTSVPTGRPYQPSKSSPLPAFPVTRQVLEYLIAKHKVGLSAPKEPAFGKV